MYSAPLCHAFDQHCFPFVERRIELFNSGFSFRGDLGVYVSAVSRIRAFSAKVLFSSVLMTLLAVAVEMPDSSASFLVSSLPHTHRS